MSSLWEHIQQKTPTGPAREGRTHEREATQVSDLRQGLCQEGQAGPARGHAHWGDEAQVSPLCEALHQPRNDVVTQEDV